MSVAPARDIGAVTPAPKKPPRRRGSGYQRLPMQILVYTLLIVGAIIFMAPFAWMVVASFKPLGEIFTYPPSWIPKNPTIDNYKSFLEAQDVARWFFNSAFVTLTIVLIQTAFCAMAAYCFAKREFPLRDGIFLLGLGTMAIPAAVLLVPNYLVLKHIPMFGGNDLLGNGGHGWLDSYWGLIAPGAVSAFGVFLIRQYMLTIPDELLDAARIDGASEFSIYWRVVLPLAKPALAATGIFTFIYAWEDFFWPLIVISSPDHYTVPLGLALYVVQNRTSWDIVMAGSVLATLPMILIFAVFQRHFIRGLAISGLKG
jgi:multiple sugar transport system permease protein